MMKNDGGSAFPIGDMHGEGGMSLRDYFAAAALQGCCANSFNDGISQPLSKANAGELANMAYSCADAMIAARDK